MHAMLCRELIRDTCQGSHHIQTTLAAFESDMHVIFGGYVVHSHVNAFSDIHILFAGKKKRYNIVKLLSFRLPEVLSATE